MSIEGIQCFQVVCSRAMYMYAVTTAAGLTSRAHSMCTNDMLFAMCSHSLPNQAICNCVHAAEKFKEWITNGKNATEERQILEHIMEGVCMCCVCTSYVCMYICMCMFVSGCVHLSVGVCVCFPLCMYVLCVISFLRIARAR